MRIVFKSRISILLTLTVCLAILTPFGFLVRQVFVDYSFAVILSLIIVSILILFVGFIWFGIRYIIDNDKVVFKTGFFNSGEIEISKIVSIKRSYLALSSNAVSLKRLRCDLKKGSKFPYLLISPANENLFLKTLKDINSSIEIDIKDKKTILNWDFRQ